MEFGLGGETRGWDTPPLSTCSGGVCSGSPRFGQPRSTSRSEGYPTLWSARGELHRAVIRWRRRRRRGGLAGSWRGFGRWRWARFGRRRRRSGERRRFRWSLWALPPLFASCWLCNGTYRRSTRPSRRRLCPAPDLDSWQPDIGLQRRRFGRAQQRRQHLQRDQAGAGDRGDLPKPLPTNPNSAHLDPSRQHGRSLPHGPRSASSQSELAADAGRAGTPLRTACTSRLSEPRTAGARPTRAS